MKKRVRNIENNVNVLDSSKIIKVIDLWYQYRCLRFEQINMPINGPKFKLNYNFVDYLNKCFSNSRYYTSLAKLKDHFNVLHLGSIDLNFIRKIKAITMEEIRIDGEPFSCIETEDGETYFFSYIPAQNTEYCLCSEEDEGYHHEHNCCGLHCEWHIPVITKIHPDGKITKFIFQGLQKDLW